MITLELASGCQTRCNGSRHRPRSILIDRSLGPSDPPPTENSRLRPRIVVEDTGLAGCHAVLTFGEQHPCPTQCLIEDERRLYRRMCRTDPRPDRQAVAGCRRFGARPEPVHVPELEDIGPKCFTGTNDHLPALGVEPHDVKWSSARQLEAAPLADRIVHDTVVPAKDTAVHVNDVARLGGAGAQALDHIGIAPGGNEADVLAVRL